MTALFEYIDSLACYKLQNFMLVSEGSDETLLVHWLAEALIERICDKQRII